MPRTSTIARASALALVAGLATIDASGADLSRRASRNAAVRVWFFVTSDCPISNGYAPEIRRICDAYQTDGVSCTLVYEDVRIDEATVRTHQAEYGTSAIHAVIDLDRRLAKKGGATVTPQAIVFDRTGARRYRGRIDNRYAALGTPRRQVTQHDLRNALDAVIAGTPVPTVETEALGCFIVPSSIPR
jgi:hypothetical protein